MSTSSVGADSRVVCFETDEVVDAGVPAAAVVVAVVVAVVGVCVCDDDDVASAPTGADAGVDRGVDDEDEATPEIGCGVPPATAAVVDVEAGVDVDVDATGREGPAEVLGAVADPAEEVEDAGAGDVEDDMIPTAAGASSYWPLLYMQRSLRG